MKRLMLEIVLCAVLMMSGSGCEEDFTPTQLQALAAQQEVLQKQVDTLQAAATQMTEDLAAAEIVDADAVAKLTKINEEADRIQAQIAVVAQALQGVPLTGDAAQDFIAQLQAANTASSGFNPYVVPVGSGLTILSVLLGWLAKRKADEAATEKVKTEVAQRKYQAHKQGAEKTMMEVSSSAEPKIRAVETQLYDNIGKARADLGV